jgi:hypothetical protein
MFNKDSVLQKEDLYFGPVLSEVPMNSICFPITTFPKPTVSVGSAVNPGEGLQVNTQVLVDDSLTEGGCSGSGWWVEYFSETHMFWGVQSAILDPESNTPNNMLLGVDNTSVYPLSHLGEDNFYALINEAIADYKNKNTP